MAWKTDSRHEKVMAEINITPLTDVMLVLLVIFMVTTPLIMSGALKVKLPAAASVGSEKFSGVTITIGADGDVELDGSRIGIAELRASLKQRFASGADTSVAVKADGSVRHSLVVKVLDIAKLAGATKLAITAQRDEDRRAVSR